MKVRIHPLFFAVIIICALFGGLPTTLVFLVTALLHECGHAFCAAGMGFKCECIKIMPYGAAAVCDLEGIKAGDEIRLALSGPAVNAAICVAVAGLWWFFPETYAYTDLVMSANLTMLIVNLIPAYPLDGGRVAGCVMAKLWGRRVALIALKATAIVCAAALIILFFAFGYNPTFLTFALFLIFSAIERAPRAELLNFSAGDRLKRGIEVKYVLCDESLTFKDAFKKLDDKRYIVLQLYDGGIVDEVTQDELYALAAIHGVYDRVFGEDYFSRKERENSDFETFLSSTAETQSTPNETPSSTAPEREEKS